MARFFTRQYLSVNHPNLFARTFYANFAPILMFFINGGSFRGEWDFLRVF